MQTALVFGAALLIGVTGSAQAQQVDLEGYLIALSHCEANIRRDSNNPGNVRLEPMRAYRMIARNSTPGTHYRIAIPGAPENEARWVAMSCGDYAPQDTLVLAGGGATGGGGGDGALAPDSIEYVLAASWQPGFCATSAGRDKEECRTQTADRADATRFSIHGLWPDDLDDIAIFPCYCDRGAPVSCAGSQNRDTSINLSPHVLAALRIAMPGVMSDLHLHEWPKHGSCYEDDKSGADTGADPDEYFSETMALLEALNGSAVQDLFEAKLGEVIRREEIEAAFDASFGAGAGDRVLVRCSRVNGENIIGALWIGLKGDISAEPDFAALIQAAPETEASADDRSCNSGRVVRVGTN